MTGQWFTGQRDQTVAHSLRNRQAEH
jgi:hypothetical protein